MSVELSATKFPYFFSRIVELSECWIKCDKVPKKSGVNLVIVFFILELVRKYLIFVWLLRVVFLLSVWQNVRADGNVAWHSRSVGVTYAKTYATHKASALLYFLMTLERRLKVLHKSRVSLYAEAPPLDIHHTVTKLICNLPDSTGTGGKVCEGCWIAQPHWLHPSTVPVSYTHLRAHET